MPSNDVITIYKGEDVDLNFTMNPVESISGWTIKLNVKSPSAVVITKTANITDASNGEFTFVLADDDSDDLSAGSYQYDVWRTDAGSERVLAIGSFVIADVVRDVS